MAEATFTIRVDEDLKSQFAEIAKAKDRTSAQLLRDFMRETIARQQEEAEYDAWYREKVGKAMAAADAGDVVSAEDAEIYFEKLRKELLAQEKAQA